jgi:hypothetical protein
MKPNAIRRLLHAALLLATAACDDALGPGDTVFGSGVLTTEIRTARDVQGVSLTTVGTVFIEQGSDERIRIEGEDNIVRNVHTRMRGGLLEIETQPGVSLRPTRPLRIFLTVRDLRSVTVTGGGTIVADYLVLDELTTTLNGSGEIHLNELDSFFLDVRISGSGAVRASGIADEQDVLIDGSGEYAARFLDSFDARVHVRSSGTATVRVRDRLWAVMAGSGAIRYYGNPAVQRTVTGTGTIARIGG